MTATEKLKWYMRPYYQEDIYADILNEYIETYKSSELAASKMWAELPPSISSGSIKSYDSGAASTVFRDLKDILEFCKQQSIYYSMLANKDSSSMAIITTPPYAVGGVRE